MGETRGFMTYPRQALRKDEAAARSTHFREFVHAYGEATLREQGARCMDCGVPFCHNACPLGNHIPEWNHLVTEERYEEALRALHATNNFPEFTGRICPAPCESACVLGINEDPVSIEGVEMALADMGFLKGWIKPEVPPYRSGKSVAVVGSGPAGLAAAQQLNRKGHWVTVFERADRPGGLLMYGIPDFKLEKAKVQRRIRILEEEGIEFRCGVAVGSEAMPLERLQKDFDAVLLTCGATKKRDVALPGRELEGIYFAEQLLVQSTRRQLGDAIDAPILASGKDVIVIGGGDTGADCVGTSRRQGARSVTQFEIMPRPPLLPLHPRAHQRPEETAWPAWTHMLRTSSSHEEGCSRHWSLETVRFEGNAAGELEALVTRELLWFVDETGKRICEPVPNSEKRWPCQMLLIAVGFVGPETETFDLKLGLDARSNIATRNYRTDQEKVFAAGDMRRGQSLVVWAIAEGREAAEAVDAFLEKPGA